ncbi:MAG: YebC/PmpR family DNA-binding transcriptional regulator [Nevskiales bacterium]|nr:YebC/PmpR family DNA-binding transcriptional regulator [Nevskiales bacterium]
MGRGPSIENRKTAEDARRGRLFTKLIREITVAARAGGDSAGNPRLRAAVDKALSANMTRDTVERAIKRGSGALESERLEEVTYEGYGPGGVAILVDCMTDNRTRTVGEVRHAFTRMGGRLAADGAVGYLFHRLGVIGLNHGAGTPQAEKALEVALETAAEDVQTHDDYTEVITRPEKLEAVKQALMTRGLAVTRTEIALRPATTVAVEGDQAEVVLKLLQDLEELDDVQTVHTNAELPHGAREKIS